MTPPTFAEFSSSDDTCAILLDQMIRTNAPPRAIAEFAYNCALGQSALATFERLLKLESDRIKGLQ